VSIVFDVSQLAPRDRKLLQSSRPPVLQDYSPGQPANTRHAPRPFPSSSNALINAVRNIFFIRPRSPDALSIGGTVKHPKAILPDLNGQNLNASTSETNLSIMSNNLDIKQGQSVELLKELHILTSDGKLNQDSRRKLKQVYHLFQFIEPLLQAVQQDQADISLVDHGAGKSYLGFILYDLFFKKLNDKSRIYCIETRDELVTKSQELAQRLKFSGMTFLNLSVAESISSTQLPATVDVVTALHACNTATDDAIRFALQKKAKFIVLVPCCQAEVASVLKKNKGKALGRDALTELWRHPIHTCEFGSHVTNILRCLQLEAHGYQVTVTELVGWEHSMKNELIIASYKGLPSARPSKRLQEVMRELGLEEMSERFFTPRIAPEFVSQE
jgi:hypothetical protein